MVLGVFSAWLPAASAPSPETGTARQQAAELTTKIEQALAEKGIDIKLPLAVVTLANIGPKCLELKIGETVSEILTDAMVKSGKLTLWTVIICRK
jgi:hypothetical protein